MYERRCYVSVAVLDELIYAMGGFDGHERLSSAEHYNPNANQWTLTAPMNDRRSDASAGPGKSLHQEDSRNGEMMDYSMRILQIRNRILYEIYSALFFSTICRSYVKGFSHEHHAYYI